MRSSFDPLAMFRVLTRESTPGFVIVNGGRWLVELGNTRNDIRLSCYLSISKALSKSATIPYASMESLSPSI